VKHRKLWSLVATAALVVSACSSGGGGGGGTGSLAGKTLIFASLGGNYQAAEVSAFTTPFMAETGATVTSLESFDTAKFVDSINAGAPIADVVDTDTTVAADLCAKGLLAKVDKSIVDLSKVDQSMISSECGVPIIRYGFGIFYNTSKFSTAPTGCKDFFDTTNFPGTRGVWSGAFPNQLLECALIADGVAPDALYPLDLNRAFAKIASIKSSLKFWGSGAESLSMMTSQEADMVMAWTGRGYAAIATQGAPYALVPNDIFVLSDDLMVPKNAADLKTAWTLVNYMLTPANQVELAKLIPYSPSRTDAQIDANAPTAPYLVSNPAFKTIAVNQKWWAENAKPITDAWASNIQQ
jgi:putative spermidine/putrescine transport system substrate-binding protein